MLVGIPCPGSVFGEYIDHPSSIIAVKPIRNSLLFNSYAVTSHFTGDCADKVQVKIQSEIKNSTITFLIIEGFWMQVLC